MRPTPTSGLCLCGGPMGDHYPSAHPAPHASPLCKCGQPLSAHAVDGQYDGGCFESGCDSFERAPVVDSAPTPEPCAGCQKVSRHPGEGYVCGRHPVIVLPTQLAQPTGRRASAIACIYIAGPYTAADAWGVEQNVRRAESLAYEVAKIGAVPMCPHSNLRFMCSEIAAFMYPATLELMRRCDAVLMVEGWEKSIGACGEYEEAGLLKMPRFWTLNGLRGWLSRRGGGA